MFKIELFFNETLEESELRKIGAIIDEFFAEDNIKKVDKTLTSRTYYDNGYESDFGKMWASLCQIKNTMNFSAFLKEAYWYENDEKDDIITEFFNR